MLLASCSTTHGLESGLVTLPLMAQTSLWVWMVGGVFFLCASIWHRKTAQPSRETLATQRIQVIVKTESERVVAETPAVS
ncbi:hypothetical protein [Anthocerotibacter panamensis]|uniref:hypothetical protein n=1 Tax=Anthocerotibacter panamensis TaxID=2857077 RepID=UPI001C4046C6|nr:hypothetical protein [Anthocerotibacter panamensis]